MGFAMDSHRLTSTSLGHLISSRSLNFFRIMSLTHARLAVGSSWKVCGAG
jgi:hypothetical protein